MAGKIIIPDNEDIRAIQRRAYANAFDQMEKKFSISSQELHIPNKQSFELLCIDLLTGGGLAAGVMLQTSGLEGGGKTTLNLSLTGASIRKEVPIIDVWDPESAMSDPDYAKACMGIDVKSVFQGKFKIGRLYQEAVLEDFYNSTKALMRSLPDKMYNNELKQWFFIFDNTKEDRIKMGDWGYKNYNKTLFQSTGRLWCETEQKGLQGFVSCDSYPALVVSALDEDDDKKILPAMNAKAFAENIRKIVGILKKKAFSVSGINQIRTNPMPMYGALPEYEPGGKALAFYSSIRLQNRPCSVPPNMFEGEGKNGKTRAFGEENSVYGGNSPDKYKYVNITNTKNKLGMPYLYTTMRVWFSDRYGHAHGFDKAYDTYQYLVMTGRISGSPKLKKGLTITGVACLKDWPPLSWDEFKILVLAYTDPAIMKRAKEIFKNKKTVPDVRKEFFKEIRTKEAYKLLAEGSAKKPAEEQEDMEA